MICDQDRTIQAIITQKCKTYSKAIFSQPSGTPLENQLFINQIIEYIINLTVNPDLRFTGLMTPTMTTSVTVDGKILSITAGFPGQVVYDSIVLPLDSLRQATITYFDPLISAQETMIVRLYDDYFTITKLVSGVIYDSSTGIISSI